MSSDNDPPVPQTNGNPLDPDTIGATQSQHAAVAAPVPTEQAVPPVAAATLADMLAGPDLPTEEVLERAEAKPPRYRLVRGAIYTTYLVLVAWFCLGVTVAVWRAVWGPDGAKLQTQEAQHGAALKNCKE